MEGGVAGQLKSLRKRGSAGILGQMLRGELGVLQVLIGLAVIWAIFQFENDRFLSAAAELAASR